MSNKYFQWKKGDDYATIETISHETNDEGITYLVFESGRKINKSLVDEFLVQIEHPSVPVLSEHSNPYKDSEKPITKMLLDYPTMEEIEAKKNNEGNVNLGKAEAIPHPSDEQKTQAFVKQQETTVARSKTVTHDPLIAGITENGLQKQDIVRPIVKHQSPIVGIIDKAKKQDYELELKISVKLPIVHFFDLLDEDFIEKNKHDLLNEMINKIKREDLDSQLKENLIKLYNIK